LVVKAFSEEEAIEDSIPLRDLTVLSSSPGDVQVP